MTEGASVAFPQGAHPAPCDERPPGQAQAADGFV